MPADPNKSSKRTKISVRGKTYDRLRRGGDRKHVKLITIVEEILAPVGLQ